ncbi:MAG: hypothetical protein VX777_00050 [Chlamydiota bacterium]|nr:hypothetical protein [Chlamydiota bacterium]
MTIPTHNTNLRKLLETRNLGDADPFHNYWDCKNDTPSTALQRLLELCIPKEELSLQPLTLQRVVDLTQKHWFVRQRWTICDTPEIISNKKSIESCYNELGHASPVSAPDGHYPYILLLSARVNVMTGRMLSLQEKISTGKITTDHIYILAGTQGLYKSEKEEDEYDILKNSKYNITSATTEEEAASELSQHIFTPINIPTTVLATKLIGKNGNVVKPSTNDTVTTWFNSLPKDTDHSTLKVLFVSDSYFGNYQCNQILPLLQQKGIKQENTFLLAEDLPERKFTEIGMSKEKYETALGIDIIARMFNDWNNLTK